MKKLFLIFLVLLLWCPIVFSGTYVIPSDRVTTWQGNVGVKGGIPDRETICTTLGTAGQVSTYAQSVTYSQINTAITNCTAGQTVYLNTGTYTIAGTINLKANVTLRGAGMNSTLLVTNGSHVIVEAYGGYTDCSSGGGISVTSGSTQGSTSIVVSSASTLSIGDHIYIDELNNSSIPVNATGTSGTAWYNACYSAGASGRNRAQIDKITGKDGNTLTLEIPLYHAYTLTPQVYKTITYIEGAGLENLTVKHGGTYDNTNIQFQGVTNSWIKGVKVEHLGARGVDFWYDNYRNEIRDSYFTGCVDQVNSDTCYGVQVSGGSANLIENNIIYNTANGVVLVAASGNVIGYNYTYGVHRTINSDNWFWPDMWTHGSHNSYNLWEGNVFTGLNFDNYWGSNSHNTVFRNKIRGKDPTLTYSSEMTDTAAIIDSQHNNYMNVVGNAVGTAGFADTYEVKAANYWTNLTIYATGVADSDTAVFPTMLRHGNYDFYSTSQKWCGDTNEPGCQGSTGTDHTLPDSLYLASKPAWFGSVTYPPVNPTAGTAADIPAKVFYDTGSWPEEGADTTPPTLSTATISTNGTTLTLVFSESVVNHTGFSVSPSNTITYSSGSGTNTLVFTLTTTVYSGATDTISYSAGDVVDTAETPNALATISSGSITNNSTQSAPSSTAKLNGICKGCIIK
jgi:parallel beta-helix repeat protein